MGQKLLIPIAAVLLVVSVPPRLFAQSPPDTDGTPAARKTQPTQAARSRVAEPPLTFLFKENPRQYYAASVVSPTDRAAILAIAVACIVAGVFVLRSGSRLTNPNVLPTFLGSILLLLGTGMGAGILYLTSPISRQTRVFSPYTLLTSAWESYKINFITRDGRVIDRTQGDITTSEGQSYAMLQSVWIDDKQTFDTVWNWTRTNLKRPGDALFGWRWGRRPDGTDGFMPDGGDNTASDADSDIALSLILASRRWNDPSYRKAADAILPDLWNIDVDTVAGNRYLVAGNWAKGRPVDVINPSYFSPYAWRIFAQADDRHPWESLIAPAYDLLAASGRSPLDKSRAVGLPPDWVAIRVDTGELVPTGLPNLTTNYSFDAMRIPWRIALDYQWNGDQRAKEYLDSLGILYRMYDTDNKLTAGYTHDGIPLSQTENPVMYATSLGYLNITHPTATQAVYSKKILQLYSNDTNSFRQDLPYYETNWLWFGSALYLNYLNAY